MLSLCMKLLSLASSSRLSALRKQSSRLGVFQIVGCYYLSSEILRCRSRNAEHSVLYSDEQVQVSLIQIE